MKYKYWIIIFLIIGLIGGAIYFFINNKNNNSQKYTAQRTEQFVNTTDSNTNTIDTIEIKNEEADTQKIETTPKETEISSFTTKIYSKDSGRQNNIRITCSSLNDTYVENGATFSFCGTVGQATTDKGYQKAEIFDNKRKYKTWSWRW